MGRLRAERHPHADLVRPLRDAVGHHSIEPDRRQRHRDACEHEQHDHRHALAGDRQIEPPSHRARFEQRQIGVERAHGRFDGRLKGEPLVHRADHERIAGFGLLRDRRVHLEWRVLREPFELHVADDASHDAPRRRRFGPALLERRGCRIFGSQRAAANDRRLERLEISRADVSEGDRRQIGAARNRLVGRDEDRVPRRSFDRQRRGHGGAHDARHSLHTPEHLVHEGEPGLAVPARPFEREVHRQQTIGIEAGVDGRKEEERSRHEAAANQEDERQRDLGDHQAAPEPVRARHTRPASNDERLAIDARCLQRGQGAEGEAQRGGVDAYLVEARRRRRGDGDEQAHEEHGQRRANDRRDAREQGALDEQLRQESRAAAAERRPHSELVSAGGAARHEQVRDIDAGDEQQQHDRREQHEQRRLDRRDHA